MYALLRSDETSAKATIVGYYDTPEQAESDIISRERAYRIEHKITHVDGEADYGVREI